MVKRKDIVARFNRQKLLFLIIAQGLVLLILFQYVPMYGAVIAFKNYNPLHGIWGSAWVGMKHFSKLFGSIFFWRTLRNTLLINVYHLIFGFPAPVIFALLLNEIQRSPVKRTVQTITYLPHFISWVIVGGFVVDILSPNTGIFTQFSRLLSGEKSDLFVLITPGYFRSVLVISGIWKNIGWGSIVYIAAISGVDPNLYEAAIIDGAGRFRRAASVTLPSILPTITVMMILRFGSMLGSNFEQILVLISPNVYEVGDVLSTFIYREGLQRMQFSYTTAVGLFQSIVGFFLIITSNSIARRLGSSLW